MAAHPRRFSMEIITIPGGDSSNNSMTSESPAFGQIEFSEKRGPLHSECASGLGLDMLDPSYQVRRSWRDGRLQSYSISNPPPCHLVRRLQSPEVIIIEYWAYI